MSPSTQIQVMDTGGNSFWNILKNVKVLEKQEIGHTYIPSSIIFIDKEDVDGIIEVLQTTIPCVVVDFKRDVQEKIDVDQRATIVSCPFEYHLSSSELSSLLSQFKTVISPSNLSLPSSVSLHTYNELVDLQTPYMTLMTPVYITNIFSIYCFVVDSERQLHSIVPY